MRTRTLDNQVPPRNARETWDSAANEKVMTCSCESDAQAMRIVDKRAVFRPHTGQDDGVKFSPTNDRWEISSVRGAGDLFGGGEGGGPQLYP